MRGSTCVLGGSLEVIENSHAWSLNFRGKAPKKFIIFSGAYQGETLL